MQRLPHVAHDPPRGQPRPRGVATWMAISCIADLDPARSLIALTPAHSSVPNAGAWFTTMPTRKFVGGLYVRLQAESEIVTISHEPPSSDRATSIPPQAMLIALRRRLRLPFTLCSSRCGPHPRCGEDMHCLGDHAVACPRTGLLARRAEVVGPCGPQGGPPQEYMRATLRLYRSWSQRQRRALCCDATLVSPSRRLAMRIPTVPRRTGSLCASQNVATTAFTPSSPSEGRPAKAGGTWHGAAIGGRRTLLHSASSATLSACKPSMHPAGRGTSGAPSPAAVQLAIAGTAFEPGFAGRRCAARPPPAAALHRDRRRFRAGRS